MTRPRSAAPDPARRAVLDARLARLKVASWALVAGAWLALWSLVSGAVAVTTAATVPPGSSQQRQTVDLFAQGASPGPSQGSSQGSSLGTTTVTPVLQSNGS
ncbi:MAG TPA: hypothetical protein VIM66_03955 [Candidatus Limnocylindria bacterium]